MNIITTVYRYRTFKTTLVPGSHVVVEAFEDGHFMSMRKFEIGDEAEYASFNLQYTGRIVSIGKATVTIDKGYGSKNRLAAKNFAWRNWDFDAAVVARRNAEIGRHI